MQSYFISPAGRASFGTYWIESGHKIREQINDDRKLIELLRFILTAYTGEGLTLYRGENIERFNNNQIGLNWTINIEVAKMFGRGLNSMPGGGLLLKGYFEPEAIICSPNNHSNYLGEGQFTVDPTSITNITVCESYSPK
jgi:hypothetical protein